MFGQGSLRCSICAINHPYAPLKWGACCQCGEKTSWSGSRPNITEAEALEKQRERDEVKSPDKYPDVFLELTEEQQREWDQAWADVDVLVERSGGMFGDAEIWLSVTKREKQ